MLTAKNIYLASIVKERITKLKEKIENANLPSTDKASLNKDCENVIQDNVSHINQLTQNLVLADKLNLARKLFEKERLRRSTENISVDRSEINSENSDVPSNEVAFNDKRKWESENKKLKPNVSSNISNAASLRFERLSQKSKEEVDSKFSESNYVKFSKGYQSKVKSDGPAGSSQIASTASSESIMKSVKETLKQFGINTNDSSLLENLIQEARKGLNKNKNVRFSRDLADSNSNLITTTNDNEKKHQRDSQKNMNTSHYSITNKKEPNSPRNEKAILDNERRSFLENFINEDWVTRNIVKNDLSPKERCGYNICPKALGKHSDSNSKGPCQAKYSNNSRITSLSEDTPPDLIQNQFNYLSNNCDNIRGKEAPNKQRRTPFQRQSNSFRRRTQSGDFVRCPLTTAIDYNQKGLVVDSNESIENTLKKMHFNKCIPSLEVDERKSPLQGINRKLSDSTSNLNYKEICDLPNLYDSRKQIRSTPCFREKNNRLTSGSNLTSGSKTVANRSQKITIKKPEDEQYDAQSIQRKELFLHKHLLNQTQNVPNTTATEINKKMNLYETLSQAASRWSHNPNDRPTSCIRLTDSLPPDEGNAQATRHPQRASKRSISTPVACSPPFLCKSQTPVHQTEIIQPRASYLGDVKSTSTYSSNGLNFKTFSTPPSLMVDRESINNVDRQVVFSPGKNFQRCQSQECIQQLADTSPVNHQRSQSVSLLHVNRTAGWTDSRQLTPITSQSGRSTPSFMMQTMSSWRRAQEVQYNRKYRESREKLRPFRIPFHPAKFSEEVERENRKDSAFSNNRSRLSENENSLKMDNQSVASCNNTLTGLTIYADHNSINSGLSSQHQKEDSCKRENALKEKRVLERRIERDKRVKEQEKWLEEEEVRRQVYDQYQKKQLGRTTQKPLCCSTNPSSIAQLSPSINAVIPTPSLAKSVRNESKESFSIFKGDRIETQSSKGLSRRPVKQTGSSSTYHARLEYDRQRRKNLMNGGIASPVTPCYASSSGDSGKSESSSSKSLVANSPHRKIKETANREEILKILEFSTKKSSTMSHQESTPIVLKSKTSAKPPATPPKSPKQQISWKYLFANANSSPPAAVEHEQVKMDCRTSSGQPTRSDQPDSQFVKMKQNECDRQARREKLENIMKRVFPQPNSTKNTSQHFINNENDSDSLNEDCLIDCNNQSFGVLQTNETARKSLSNCEVFNSSQLNNKTVQQKSATEEMELSSFDGNQVTTQLRRISYGCLLSDESDSTTEDIPRRQIDFPLADILNQNCSFRKSVTLQPAHEPNDREMTDSPANSIELNFSDNEEVPNPPDEERKLDLPIVDNSHNFENASDFPSHDGMNKPENYLSGRSYCKYGADSANEEQPADSLSSQEEHSEPLPRECDDILQCNSESCIEEASNAHNDDRLKKRKLTIVRHPAQNYPQSMPQRGDVRESSEKRDRGQKKDEELSLAEISPVEENISDMVSSFPKDEASQLSMISVTESEHQTDSNSTDYESTDGKDSLNGKDFT